MCIPPEERIDGLHFNIADFHKEMKFMQVAIMLKYLKGRNFGGNQIWRLAKYIILMKFLGSLEDGNRQVSPFGQKMFEIK